MTLTFNNSATEDAFLMEGEKKYKFLRESTQDMLFT